MKTLHTFEEVSKMITEGRTLVLAGCDDLLEKLPRGNWIGGTSTVFLDENGGEEILDRIFVYDLTDKITNSKICCYRANELQGIITDQYKNGFVYMLMPVFSEVMGAYSLQAYNLDGIFRSNPIFGWVTGMKEVATEVRAENIHGAVFHGQTGEKDSNLIIAMHCELPPNRQASLETFTPFSQGEGDVFTFKETCMQFDEFYVNGKLTNAVEYFTQPGINPYVPLYANMTGANMCVVLALMNLKKEDKFITSAAPLIQDVEYQFAKMAPDYAETFASCIPRDSTNLCASTSCYVNYLMLDLKGKRLGNLRGPFAFGEVGYLLMNQTTVNLYIKEV